MREKLIELLSEHCAYKEKRCVGCDPDGGYYHPECRTNLFGKIADHLIANGVTVREESGCEYCLEDRDGYRRGFGAFSLHNPFHASVWEISTGHCKPRQIYFCPMCGRKLAEPPSGERRTDG